MAERGSLVSLPREGRWLQQGTRDPCVASGFGSQKSQWQGGGSSGGELGKKWLWERKSPKLSFGSGNSGSLFFKRDPAVAAPQGGFRFFFFSKEKGRLQQVKRGRVSVLLSKREDQMAKGGAAACSMFFSKRQEGGCGSGRKSLGLGLGLGFFFCFLPHFKKSVKRV